jgi:signal transduction histidine kinase
VAELINFYNQKGNTEQLMTTGHRVVKAAKTINFLLDNLLQWSLSQKGELQMRPERISLYELITEVTEIYKDTAVSKNIRLEVLASENVYLWADQNACHTILRNLLNNALKFTQPGGRVIINFEANRESAKIIIKDNGIGIPPENMVNLFDLKEHKGTKGTAKEKGTGLGLVLVKEMVRLNQGQLSISSNMEEKGTTVHLSLPLFR